MLAHLAAATLLFLFSTADARSKLDETLGGPELEVNGPLVNVVPAQLSSLSEMTKLFNTTSHEPPTKQVPLPVLRGFGISFFVLAVCAAVWVMQIAEPLEVTQSLLGDNPQDVEHREEVEPLSLLRLLMIATPQFGYGFQICMWINVVPQEVSYLYPENPGVTYSVLLAICSFFELAGPIWGHASDRLRTPYGRRRPVLVCIALGIATFMMGMWIMSATQHPFGYLACTCAGVLVGSALVPVFQGLVVDVVPRDQVDVMGTCNAVLFTVGALSSFIFALFMEGMYYWHYIIAITATVTGSLVVCLACRESLVNNDMLDEVPTGFGNLLKYFYWLDVHQYRDYAVVLLCKGMMYGIAVTKSFIVYFIRDTYNVTEDAVLLPKVASIALWTEISALIMAGLTMAFMTKGAMKPLSIAKIGPVISSLSWLLLAPCGFDKSSYDFLEWISAVYGIGYGFSLAADQALTLEYIPNKENASRYMGLQSVVTCVAALAFSSMNAALLAVFGSAMKWQLPGARAAPVPDGGYRLEGYIGLFVVASFLSVVWSFLYSMLSQEKKLSIQTAEGS